MREQKNNAPALVNRPEKTEKVYYGETLPPLRPKVIDEERLREIRVELYNISHTHEHHSHFYSIQAEGKDEPTDPFGRAGLIVGESVVAIGGAVAILVWMGGKALLKR